MLDFVQIKMILVIVVGGLVGVEIPLQLLFQLGISLMRITINRLRNERLAKGQYTDAADDMLLKLF